MPLMASWREWVERLKRDTMALYYASRDPRTPLAAKLLAAAIVAYAVSPIDLIPDFIPVLGLLDDLVLLPLGMWLVLRLIPDDVMAESRVRAGEALERPQGRTAAVVIVLVWLGAAALCGWVVYT
jgi:uncharacterized membrane protein YkvA (DUF1232 family)